MIGVVFYMAVVVSVTVLATPASPIHFALTGRSPWEQPDA